MRSLLTACIVPMNMKPSARPRPKPMARKAASLPLVIRPRDAAKRAKGMCLGASLFFPMLPPLALRPADHRRLATVPPCKCAAGIPPSTAEVLKIPSKPS